MTKKRSRSRRAAVWAIWIVTAVAAIVAAVWANRVLFARRIASEATRMWAAAAPARPIDGSRLGRLPPPVRSYLERALGRRERTVASARLRHGGAFRPKLDGPWRPIEGVQYFATDPPGFVWWGRLHISPVLWIDARDRAIGGVGSMLVQAASTVTLADARGPEIDQGALLRLLAELLWLPTALLDERHIAWTPLDDRRAMATLTVGGRKASGVFEFGDDGLPAAFRAERYRDLGRGRSALTPFTGVSEDYRPVDGLLVPHRMTAVWDVEGRPIPYAQFLVERLEYDAATPF